MPLIQVGTIFMISIAKIHKPAYPDSPHPYCSKPSPSLCCPDWCAQDFKESYLLTYFFLHATSLLFDLNWVVTTYSGSFMVRRISLLLSCY